MKKNSVKELSERHKRTNIQIERDSKLKSGHQGLWAGQNEGNCLISSHLGSQQVWR